MQQSVNFINLIILGTISNLLLWFDLHFDFDVIHELTWFSNEGRRGLISIEDLMQNFDLLLM